MEQHLPEFTRALHERRQIKIIMRRKTKQTPLIATCAPLDVGPRRATADDADYLHVWKFPYQYRAGYVMAIAPGTLVKLEVLDETFDPAAVVTWDRTGQPWHLARGWGALS